MLTLDDKKVLIISITSFILLLFGGCYYLVSQWGYYEDGQGILLVAYAISCFAAFFAIRFTNPFQIIASLVLLAFILFYATQKFEWRKEYVENTLAGKSFLLEPYIDTYPILESYHFGWLWGAPDYVRFSNDCIAPALHNQKPGIHCNSQNSIRSEYNIDAFDMVNEHYKVMQSTAKRVESGRLKSKKQYQQCLANKTCAIIPLLPANVDAESIDRQSQDYLPTRKMFWSLVNDPKISPEICEFMDLCRALRNLEVMPIERPQAK